MGDPEYLQSPSAPFNMAIATLMSLRNTLDKIRDIEARIDLPAEERQRIKLELVKRFYVDSSPLIFRKDLLDKYEFILDLKLCEVVTVNRSSLKKKKKIVYDPDLNRILDSCLVALQIELQKNKYFMPPSEDLGSTVGKMS